MFSYLKDPLREVEQPYFHQDEVRDPSLTITLHACRAFRFCKLVEKCRLVL